MPAAALLDLKALWEGSVTREGRGLESHVLFPQIWYVFSIHQRERSKKEWIGFGVGVWISG